MITGHTPHDWVVGRQGWTGEVMVFNHDGDYPEIVRRWPHVRTVHDAEEFIADRRKAYDEAVFI